MKDKYPLMPLYIVKQQNGRYRNMKSGEWVSTSQLKRYAPTEPKTQQESKETQEHWINKYYGN